jgi:serine/threonine protein kinase
MAVSVDQFGKSLVASGLMTAEDVKASWNAIPAEVRPKDGDGFAQTLVDSKRLTSFQAAELLAGRGARLMMGDYTIVAQIGAGGMGQVYKAQHRRMKRTVALKVMSNAAMQDAAAVKRFQREVHAAARLEHPNIVTAYDSGEAGSVKYLVMQFVDGGDLSELVKKQGRLGIEQAVGYVIQAARGLAFAHAEGVIHRDIKPANLLLDKKGVVKILDMGLARFEDGGDGLTATEQVMGTVDYMSPEQAADTKHADARADIYSLGCTLWYLLTAKKVYEADTLIARLMKHRDGALPSLVKERDDAPWPLERTLYKMIAKRADDRYQSMNDVIAALGPYGGESPSSGDSSSGMGSGIGHNADLASFMQSMRPDSGAASVSATQSKLGTKLSGDATAHLNAPDAGTDPKHEVLRSAPKSATPSSSPSTPSSSTSANQLRSTTAKLSSGNLTRMKLTGAGVLSMVIIVVGLVLKVRTNEGRDEAESSSTGQAKVTAGTLPSNGAVAAKPAVAMSSNASFASVAQLLDSPDYVWSEPENLGPNVNDVGDVFEISLTADELLVCGKRKDPTGTESFFEAQRKSKEEPFGPRRIMPGINEPNIAPDGLSLFGIRRVGDTANNIQMRRRATRDNQWDDTIDLGTQVNSTSDERSPRISADGLSLVFSSGRDPSQLGLWMSRRNSLGESLGAATNVGPPVNTLKGPHPTAGLLLADGRTFVFRRGGEWYITHTSKSGFKSAISLSRNYFTTSFLWIAPDGYTAYFSAARPGGFGGTDVWLSRRVPKSSAAANSKSPGTTDTTAGNVAYLDDLPEKLWQGYSTLGKHGKSLNDAQIEWKGKKVEHSLFTAPSNSLNLAFVEYDLGGRYESLAAAVYLLRAPTGGPQTFKVIGDGRLLWESIPQSTPGVEQEVLVDVRGVQTLRLEVVGLTSYSMPVWFEPRLTAVPKSTATSTAGSTLAAVATSLPKRWPTADIAIRSLQNRIPGPNLGSMPEHSVVRK